MGNAIVKQIIFPAPEASERAGLRDVIWDERPKGTPGGGQRRPFLWLKREGASTTIIYFHANGEDLALCRDHLSWLRERLGASVLAVEYPGYGLLRGEAGAGEDVRSTVKAIDHAAVHALRFVVGQGATAAQVLLHGHSIGSGPALRLAKVAQDKFHWSVGGVVLQSPFISISKVAADHAGGLAACLVPNYYDNLGTLRDLCCEMTGWGSQGLGGDLDEVLGRPCIPLLILHGERDETIAPYHGKTLYREARSCGHPAVQAAFPDEATHSSFDNLEELVQPILTFMHCHFDAERPRGVLGSLACIARPCQACRRDPDGEAPKPAQGGKP